MANPRYAEADVSYRGKSIKTALDDACTSVTYEDPASGEGDSLTLEMADPDSLWIGPWYPTQGDKISGSISVRHWLREGDNRSLRCGEFTFDEFGFSIGTESTVSISGMSNPADDAFGETERSKTWENVTVRQVAQDIASAYGLSLAYDADNISIKSVEQSKTTDSAFLTGLCKDYGLSIKIFSNRLVIFDREAYKKKAPVATFKKADCAPMSGTVKLKGTYTGGELTYSDGDEEAEVQFRLGGGKRILRLNEKADSDADAQRRLRCALNDANHEMNTLSITRMGDTDIVAGQCVTLSGFGKLDGKYYINKVTHSVTAGQYTCAYELSKVEILF